MWLKICVLLFAFIALSEELMPCKIEVRVESRTAKKVKCEIIVPSLNRQSLPIILEKEGQKKKTRFEGPDCDSKPWLIKTYSFEDNDQWKDAKNVTAKLSGSGYIKIIVEEDYRPLLHDRMGVMCSEGLCG